MAKTKQTARLNPPGQPNLSPRLATAPHHELLLRQNTEQAPEQTPEGRPETSFKTSEAPIVEMPDLRKRSNESLFYVVKLGNKIVNAVRSDKEERKII